MSNQKLICGLTTDEIETLKAKHGSLILVTISQDDQKYQVVFKEPTLQIMEVLGGYNKRGEDVKAVGIAYNNCVLAADDEVGKRDMLKIKAVDSLMNHTQKMKDEAKNL